MKHNRTSGLAPTLTDRFQKLLSSGKSITDLTNPRSKSYMVPKSRFKKHCELNPAWAKIVLELSRAVASKKAKDTNNRRLATKKICLNGLHPMKGHNVMILNEKGWRRCRACYNVSILGKPLTSENKDQIIAALERGASVDEILYGRPTGGGPRDLSLRIINSSRKFYHACKTDPEFASIVKKHTADSGFVAQAIRRAKDIPPEMRPTVIAMGRLRYGIETMAGGKYAGEIKRQQNNKRASAKRATDKLRR